MRLRVLPLIATAAALVLAVGVAPAVATPPGSVPPGSATGTYYPAGPTRILDTRSGVGARGPVDTFGTIRLYPNTGNSNAGAVVLNLTVANPTTSGYLTAFPTGKARPGTSSINFPAGRPTANLVTVPIGVGGGIDIYNGSGRTDVVADFLGFYAKDNTPIEVAGRGRGGGYHPTDPDRLLDTRAAGGRPLPGGQYVRLAVSFGSRSKQIAALAVNITVTNTRANGYLTAWDAKTSTPPTASTLNYTRGATIANAAIVPTSPCTTADGCTDPAVKIGIVNGSGAPTDVVVDITGYFDDGTVAAPVRYFPLDAPVRIVDSRSNLGLTKLGQKATQTFTPPAPVAGTTTVGLDTNVTVVRPTASTYLTLWPQLPEVSRPGTSTVNSPAGQVVSNHAVQEVGTGNRVNVYNAAGTTDVVVDVSGTFEYVATGDARAGAPDRLTGARVLPPRAAAVS